VGDEIVEHSKALNGDGAEDIKDDETHKDAPFQSTLLSKSIFLIKHYPPSPQVD
jgi:hypothetical protein